MHKSAMVLAACLVAAPLAAQDAPRSNTAGFFLTGHLSGAALRIDENGGSGTESGGGLGVHVGYGLSSNWLLLLAADVATIESEDPELVSNYGLAHVEIGARYSFASPNRAWIPYLQAAYGGRAVAAETIVGDLEMSGTVLSVGGGIQYFVSPKVALSGTVLWSTGPFDTIEIDGRTATNDADVDATSTRVNLGVAWYPRGR